MDVGYLGPPGTVSHAALLAADPDAEGVALDTLRDVVLAVQERELPRALAPVENALEGGVDPVLDALALDAPDVVLVGELVHPVSYCLAGALALAPGELTTVLSHPQATGQCARWLAANAPRAIVMPAASTADAVREVATGPPGPRAAIGTRVAAERYGALVLADEIEDDPGNATRFAWLAHAADAGPSPPDGPAKTALVFWGAGSSGPGWLVSCLDEFARRAINLTRIESRPLRRGLGEYMFFLDLEGSLADPAVAEAVEGLRGHADLVRVLGSFPAAAHG
jgi:prephenate dehydratase